MHWSFPSVMFPLQNYSSPQIERNIHDRFNTGIQEGSTQIYIRVPRLLSVCEQTIARHELPSFPTYASLRMYRTVLGGSSERVNVVSLNRGVQPPPCAATKPSTFSTLRPRPTRTAMIVGAIPCSNYRVRDLTREEFLDSTDHQLAQDSPRGRLLLQSYVTSDRMGRSWAVSSHILDPE
jgi:hypothetical protein